MSQPLQVTEKNFEGHLGQATKIILAALDGQPDAKLIALNTTEAVVADLVGSSCEPVERNLGQTRVLPFVSLHNELWAWLGYQESWGLPTKKRGKTLEFRFSSVSIFFGMRNDIFKPQVFRSEWAGWAPWRGGAYAFQGGNAGHPHWQFDVLDSLQRDADAERAQFLEALRGVEEPARDFAPEAPSVRDLVAAQRLSRLHFPSAAAWWKAAPENRHAHAPASVIEIRSWLAASLSYLRSELTNLKNRRLAP